MKKLLIFDLDGTLINTLEDLKNAVNHALTLQNFPLRTQEQVRKDIGNGVAKLIARSIPDHEDNPLYLDTLKKFREYYSVHSMDYSVPYEGVYEALINLKQEGYLLAVATNKLTEIAKILMDKFYPNIFDIVQGDEPGMDRKPAPMMVHSICQKLNVPLKDAFYIGDTNVDMQTGMNSGVDFVLVTYGFRTKEELDEQCKGKPTIDSISKLSNYLKTESL